MNIVQHINEYLKEVGNAKVSGFGTFFLKNVQAKMDAETKSILPPSQEVGFNEDYKTLDDGLIRFISTKENISVEEVIKQLKNLTDYWKNKLSLSENLSVEGLGQFHVADGKLHFLGDRIESAIPDFYGLEKIDLSQIKSSKSINNVGEKRKSSTIWYILFAVLLSALSYFAYTQREMLFGKKSFEDEPVKKEPQLPVVDSIAIKQKISDSLRIDSLKQDSIKKKAAVKTWKPKKYYKKNKWSKAKQHRNR